MKHETVTELVKASPPVSVLAAYFAGFTVNDLAAALAVVYTALLIAEKLYRWRQDWKAKQRNRRR